LSIVEGPFSVARRAKPLSHDSQLFHRRTASPAAPASGGNADSAAAACAARWRTHPRGEIWPRPVNPTGFNCWVRDSIKPVSTFALSFNKPLELTIQSNHPLLGGPPPTRGGSRLDTRSLSIPISRTELPTSSHCAFGTHLRGKPCNSRAKLSGKSLKAETKRSAWRQVSSHCKTPTHTPTLMHAR
jgi:hypothetical protein